MRLHQPVTIARFARVSVVVPCYKYGRYLRGAVQSALDQPGVDVDVLIIDDASPDNSADVARLLAAEDPRVRVEINAVNLGHIATYNRGLAEVDGDYVVLLSADDLLAPGCLARAVALMQAHPSVGFTYGYAPDFGVDPPVPRFGRTIWQTWAGWDWLSVMCARGRNLIANPEVVMRREVLDDLGAYDGLLPHSGDMELWMRAALYWDVGRVAGPDQGYYRRHGENMQVQLFGGLLDDLEGRRLAFDKTLQRSAAGVLPDDQRWHLQNRADRALAREALELAIRALDNGNPDAAVRAKGYVSFAEQVWKPVVGTARWRAAQARVDQGRPLGLRSVISETVYRLRGKVRWRVWRRLGV